ncbi:MAG: family N-acetyltransferase [Acidimicrobiales bacterium]|nr:family N-acetyltransferase [Acidimicrobiales bacterium]
MIVRDAQPDDLAEIGALIRELAVFEELEHEVVWDIDALGAELFGPEPAARVLLAEVDGGVAGFALWFPTFSTFLGSRGIWLEDLFVRDEHRGGGIGRALIGALRDRTDGRVEWNVLDWNARAIAFYQSLGARPIEGWTTYRWLPGTRS